MVRTRLFCVILLLATDVIAQYTSGIEGTVVDQSGSAISNARVVITNEATQVTRELTTNASGYFRAPDLAPDRSRTRISPDSGILLRFL